MSSLNHSSGRIVTSSPKCELLIPSNLKSGMCHPCAGERRKRDRERFDKLERVEPIFTVEDEIRDREALKKTFLASDINFFAHSFFGYTQYDL